MAKDLKTSVTLDPALAARVDKLVGVLARDSAIRARGRVTRAAVLRLAVLEGVTELEFQHVKQPAVRGV